MLTRQMLLKMGASAGGALTGPVAPDFQDCGYSDPDHSWEGFLVQHNGGRMDGFLQRPTPPADNPGGEAGRGEQSSIGPHTNTPALPSLGTQNAAPAPSSPNPKKSSCRAAASVVHDAGPLPVLHELPVTPLQQHARDAVVLEHVRHGQTSRSGPDDDDGGLFTPRTQIHPSKSKYLAVFADDFHDVVVALGA